MHEGLRQGEMNVKDKTGLLSADDNISDKRIEKGHPYCKNKFHLNKNYYKL